MFLSFLASLRAAQIPVSLREYLVLVEALGHDLAGRDAEQFYHLARACLVKDERNIDRFDQVFAATFRGLDSVVAAQSDLRREIPQEWLRRQAETYLTEAEKAELKALGYEKLMETLRLRLAEQRERHQGGSKWIGTGGVSPFGAHGFNPEGVRIGQDGGNFRAAKVWDQRAFRDLDGDARLSGRSIRLALRRLRRFARAGAAEEFDLEATVHETAARGYLEVKLRPERRNGVRVLAFFDVGGSMDFHIQQAETLFAAARGEFRQLEHFYFHNCIYEAVWRSNARRHAEKTATFDIVNGFGREHRAIIVGDASMSPHEIAQPGGSVEHMNAEAGAAWVLRLAAAFPRLVWLNPVPQEHWGYTHSIGMVRELLGGRMFPLTLDGLDAAMRALAR